jgi:hypothetical protein
LFPSVLVPRDATAMLVCMVSDNCSKSCASILHEFKLEPCSEVRIKPSLAMSAGSRPVSVHACHTPLIQINKVQRQPVTVPDWCAYLLKVISIISIFVHLGYCVCLLVILCCGSGIKMPSISNNFMFFVLVLQFALIFGPTIILPQKESTYIFYSLRFVATSFLLKYASFPSKFINFYRFSHFLSFAW